MDVKLIIDNPVVSKQVFFPRKTNIPLNLDSTIEVFKLPIDKKVVIGGLLYLKDTDISTVLLFHGNGEIALDYQFAAPLYFKCDVNLAVIDYRGYGFSSGEPYFTSLIFDAMPIYNNFKIWAEKFGLLDSFFIQGRSLGSVCAAEIGAHNPELVKGIIIESGFASLYNMMTNIFRIESDMLTPNSLASYSNDIRVRKFSKPTLIIHGVEDYVIPSSEGVLLYNNLPENIEKELVLIEGVGHNTISMQHKEYFDSFNKFTSTFKH